MNMPQSQTDRQTDRQTDWIGNSKAIYTPLGASNHSKGERAENDYYATSPNAINYLLFDGKAPLSHKILEPSCGAGHLSKRLEELGYEVKSMDIADRGYGETGIDFLNWNETWDYDILTNPPYIYASEFIEHSLDIIKPGSRVYMFLKLQFLEGKGRKKLWDRRELETLYVSRSRIICAKNGEFEKVTSSAVAYGWFAFRKGYQNDPIVKWIN